MPPAMPAKAIAGGRLSQKLMPSFTVMIAVV